MSRHASDQRLSQICTINSVACLDCLIFCLKDLPDKAFRYQRYICIKCMQVFRYMRGNREVERGYGYYIIYFRPCSGGHPRMQVFGGISMIINLRGLAFDNISHFGTLRVPRYGLLLSLPRCSAGTIYMFEVWAALLLLYTIIFHIWISIVFCFCGGRLPMERRGVYFFISFISFILFISLLYLFVSFSRSKLRMVWCKSRTHT